MKVLVPIAAQDDSFFHHEEFVYPKPLIDVDGKPMIARAVECLQRIGPDVEFIFVTRSEDCQKFSLDSVLSLLTHGRCQVVQLRYPTRGAVCSCLMAIDHIAADQPLVVANGDQILDADLAEAVARFQGTYDAGVITFDSIHPRWSYVLSDGKGTVVEAAEKRVISRNAIAGFYWYAKGSSFINAAMRLIEHDVQHNGAYYVAPTLNELILQGKRVGHCEMPASGYHSFYSPQKIEEYQRSVQRSGGESVARREPERINIVIPMAGRGSRFRDAGYTKPKPFIDADGKMMIERVLDNLKVPNAQFILIAQQEHLDAEPELAANLAGRPDVRIVPLNFMTEGSACTLLLARPFIDNDVPILIANCDQIVDMDVADFVRDCHQRGLDGSILCFQDLSRDPKWSFAKVASNGLVTETREKVAISDLATVGMYYFSRGKTFIDAATDMIAHNDRVNSEFYTCPVYNYAIRHGSKIGAFTIPMDAIAWHRHSRRSERVSGRFEAAMNCIVPLAGPDFFSPAYGFKPLYPVDGEPLLLRALRSRAWYRSGRLRNAGLVFVLRRIQAAEQFAPQLAAWFPGSRTVWLSDVSRGALLSALAGSALVERPAAPVVIDLVDVLFDCEADAFNRCSAGRASGALPWFESCDPAFSYARIAADGITVQRTAEKEVISRHASAGVYGFADLPTWLRAAAYGLAHAASLAVGGVHFVCPAMNGILDDGGRRVEAFEVSNVQPISKLFK